MKTHTDNTQTTTNDTRHIIRLTPNTTHQQYNNVNHKNMETVVIRIIIIQNTHKQLVIHHTIIIITKHTNDTIPINANQNDNNENNTCCINNNKHH